MYNDWFKNIKITDIKEFLETKEKRVKNISYLEDPKLGLILKIYFENKNPYTNNWEIDIPQSYCQFGKVYRLPKIGFVVEIPKLFIGINSFADDFSFIEFMAKQNKGKIINGKTYLEDYAFIVEKYINELREKSIKSENLKYDNFIKRAKKIIIKNSEELTK